MKTPLSRDSNPGVWAPNSVSLLPGGLLCREQLVRGFSLECPHPTRHALRCSASRSAVSDSLRPHGLYRPWDSPGQNTGVGSLSLLQGIFPTQGSNPGLPHCRQILHQLSHKSRPLLHLCDTFVPVLVSSPSFVWLFCDPMDWDFPGKNTGVCCHFLSPGYLPSPGIKPLSPA